MSEHRRTRALSSVLLLTIVIGVAGCGSKTPVGPSVVGEALPAAENQLKAAGVSYSTHATDALFGVIIPDDFVVCSEKYVSQHSVLLNVAKHGC